MTALIDYIVLIKYDTHCTVVTDPTSFILNTNRHKQNDEYIDKPIIPMTALFVPIIFLQQTTVNIIECSWQVY